MKAVRLARIVFEGLEKGSSVKDVSKATGMSEKALWSLCSSLKFSLAANDSDIDDYLDFLEEWEAHSPGSLFLPQNEVASGSDTISKPPREDRSKTHDLEVSEMARAHPRILALVDSIVSLSAELDKPDADLCEQASPHLDAQLYALADHLISERQLRHKHLPSILFGEPAWDMLLDLFRNCETGKLIPVKSLCIASGVPETTAKRYIGLLEDKGLLSSRLDQNDRRVKLVALSELGRSLMRSLLIDLHRI